MSEMSTTKNISDFRIQKRTALSLIPIFLLTVIVGSRLLGFDRDFEQYVEFYNEIGAGETSRFEFAFVLLGKIVQAFFGTGFSSLINLDFSFLVFLFSCNTKTNIVLDEVVDQVTLDEVIKAPTEYLYGINLDSFSYITQKIKNPQ